MKYQNLKFNPPSQEIPNSSEVGFTLIEMLIYVLLVVAMLGGSIAITYEILTRDYSLKEGMALEEEGNFILRKIGWALNDSTVGYPVPNSSGSYLTVTKFGLVQPITIDSNSGVVRIDEGSGATVISASRFTVSSLSFEFVQEGTLPNQTGTLKASFIIDGRQFKLSRYIR